MTQTVMKAAVVASRGPASFRIEDRPIPTPGPGQVLIKVESAGVNFSDVKRRRGDAYPFKTAFPFVPGGEVAGTIAAHGPGVDQPAIGTRVFALAGDNGFGGYAQFALAYAPTAHPIPAAFGFDAASVLTVAGGTAKIMLQLTARLQEGESILIPAATGGVGSFALRLAKLMKAAPVIAAVGHDAKRDAALALGADAVVNYARSGWPAEVRELTDGRGVDVALEASGGAALAQTLQAAAPFARVIVFGAASGTSAHLDPATIDRLLYAPADNQSLTGFNIGAWFVGKPAVAGGALGELIGEILSGAIPLPKITALPLGEAQQAHELLERRLSSGKLVLKPWL